MKHNRIICLVMSDTHCGFELGLANPHTVLPQRYAGDVPVKVTETNIFLWEDIFLPGIARTKELAGKDPVIALHIGDMTHGGRYMEETLSTKIASQFYISADAMSPVFDIPSLKLFRIVNGTAAHSFGEGSSESLVALILRERFPKKDIAVYPHNLLNINGFTIDVAHHGPSPGIRNWLKGNYAKLYLQSLMMDEIALGNTPPKLVLRGHYHEYIKVWHGIKQDGYYHEGWLVIAPPLSLIGDWSRQATKSVYIVSPGVLALEVVNGRLYDIHFFGKTIDIRMKEEVTV